MSIELWGDGKFVCWLEEKPFFGEKLTVMYEDGSKVTYIVSTIETALRVLHRKGVRRSTIVTSYSLGSSYLAEREVAPKKEGE